MANPGDAARVLNRVIEVAMRARKDITLLPIDDESIQQRFEDAQATLARENQRLQFLYQLALTSVQADATKLNVKCNRSC